MSSSTRYIYLISTVAALGGLLFGAKGGVLELWMGPDPNTEWGQR